MDENLLELPDEWRTIVHPRRGDRDLPEAGIDASAKDRLAAMIEEEAGAIGKALDAGGDPEVVESTRRYLDGKADPVGAAMVAVLLNNAFPRRPGGLPDWLVDAWLVSHGLPFAASATVYLNVAETYRDLRRLTPHLHLRAHADYNRAANCLRRARLLLAAADEHDHRAAVEALERHRNLQPQRLETAYLVPGRVDWVEECCKDPDVTGRHNKWRYWLLPCCVSTPAHADLLAQDMKTIRRGFPEDAVATMVHGLGVHAVAPLKAWLPRLEVEAGKKVLRALAAIPTDEAFQVLVDRLDDKHVQPVLIRAMHRFPVRTLRLLGPVAAGRSRTAALAADLLRGHLRAHHGTAVEALPDLPEAARAPVEALLEEVAGDRIPDAPADALPKVLVEPPWKAEGRKKTRRVVIGDLAVPAERSIVWARGERKRWRMMHHPWWKDGDEDVAVMFRRRNLGNQLWILSNGPEEKVRPLLAEWRPDFKQVVPTDPRVWVMLAKYEGDALHVLDGLLDNHASKVGELLLPFLGAAEAAMAARWLARVRNQRKTALAWFDRHRLNAVPYLVPAALGKGAPRGDAEAALRLLASRHGADRVVDAVRRSHGDRPAEAIAVMLAADPLEALPPRMPKIGAWADPRTLPRVLLRDRRHALPAEAVGHLLSMLAISKPDDVYPGVGVVREACDPASLAEFSWQLFRRWDTHGAQSSDGWALTQLGWLGDDETVRRLAPLLRSWSSEGRAARVAAGLDVLAALGSDVALLHLDVIARTARSLSLRKKARARLDEVAAERKLSPQRLADRLAPTFDLDADGGMTLDYGPRRFRVGFDERLKPYVIDGDGTLLKTLPRPGADDDPERAPAAYERFAALKKDVAKVADTQLRRLERAMADRRSWPVEEFRRFIVDHPLVWHIARRLVWMAELPSGSELPAGAASEPSARSERTAGSDRTAGSELPAGTEPSAGSGPGAAAGPGAADSGARVFSFRIAEDRTFADLDDTEVTLPADARITVAHPVHLGEQVAAWSELFADYEILQPFPQLGRPVHVPTGDERGSDRLVRFEGLKTYRGRLAKLRYRAWDGDQVSYGYLDTLHRYFPDGYGVVLSYTPPYDTWSGGGENLEHEITGVRVVRLTRDEDGREEEVPARLGDLDAVGVSELLADLTWLTAPRSS